MGKFNPGDTVILSGVNMRDSETVTVTRVGHKNVYVERYGREMAFDLEDGTEKGYYDHHCIYTVGEWAETRRRDAVIDALRDRGVSLDRSRRNIATTRLERLLAVLDEEE